MKVQRQDYRYLGIAGGLCGIGFTIVMIQIADAVLMVEWVSVLIMAMLWTYLVCSLCIPGTSKRRKQRDPHKSMRPALVVGAVSTLMPAPCREPWPRDLHL